MRRLFLTSVAIIAISFCTHAQQKGELYLGGNVGFDCAASAVALSDGYDTGSETTIQANVGLNFTIGYFLSDTWRIAAYYETNATASGTYIGAEEVTPTILAYDSAGLGLAYYKEIADGFYYVPELKICKAWGDVNIEVVNFPLDGYSFNISLFQLEYRPTTHFATSMNIGYLNFLGLGGAAPVSGHSVGLAVNTVITTINLRPTVIFKYYF